MKEIHDERKRYVTRKPWLDFPAGTECWAERRADDTLVLTFDDGRSVEPGASYLADGIECWGCHLGSSDRDTAFAIGLVVARAHRDEGLESFLCASHAKLAHKADKRVHAPVRNRSDE